MLVDDKDRPAPDDSNVPVSGRGGREWLDGAVWSVDELDGLVASLEDVAGRVRRLTADHQMMQRLAGENPEGGMEITAVTANSLRRAKVVHRMIEVEIENLDDDDDLLLVLELAFKVISDLIRAVNRVP